LFLLFAFGAFVCADIPCTQPANETLPADVQLCSVKNPIIIGTAARYCAQNVSSGETKYYAFILSDNNAQLKNLQFGIRVTIENAAVLGSTDSITVLSATNACPDENCPMADNAFKLGCDYDHKVDTRSTDPIQFTYRNAPDSVYYIAVTVKSSQRAPITVPFSIEINDGELSVLRFLPPIVVLPFCALTIIGLVVLYYVRNKSYSFSTQDVEMPQLKKSIVRENTVQSLGTLPAIQQMTFSLPIDSVQQANQQLQQAAQQFHNTTLNGDQISSVVTLFREQAAILHNLGVSIPISAPPQIVVAADKNGKLRKKEKEGALTTMQMEEERHDE